MCRSWNSHTHKLLTYMYVEPKGNKDIAILLFSIGSSFTVHWGVNQIILNYRTCALDTIQDFRSKLGMKLWINWISRNNLSLTITLVRSTNIIKDLFHFFCLIARIFLIQHHKGTSMYYVSTKGGGRGSAKCLRNHDLEKKFWIICIISQIWTKPLSKAEWKEFLLFC